MGLASAWVALTLTLTLALVACYEPRYGECLVRCSDAAHCAPGQVCGEDGWCASSELAGQCSQSLVPDARIADAPRPSPDVRPPPTDSGMPDTSGPACSPGCLGTCRQGVCEIECTASGSCQQDVVCPATGPCRVVCSGLASCRGEVRCGDGPCEVECSGPGACRKGVECDDACACDVACTGPGSCQKASDCPANACREGRGCTSEPSGCDQC